MNILATALLLICSPNAIVDFALPQWRAEPQIRIEDAYKWIYQATRGGEHAVPDEATARAWLEREWQTLGDPLAGEPISQRLCPDAEIVRLNLRPFRAKGGRMDHLLTAFVQSSQIFDNNELNFIAAWKELGKRLKRKSYGTLKWSEWKRLDDEMRTAGYPAIHHSEVYNRERQPAYRILTGDVARKLLLELKPLDSFSQYTVPEFLRNVNSSLQLGFVPCHGTQ